MISSLQSRFIRNQLIPLRNLLLGLAPAVVLTFWPSAACAQRFSGRMAPVSTASQTFSSDGAARSEAAQYPVCTANPSSIEAGRRTSVRLGVTYPNANVPPNIIFYAVRVQPNGSPQKIATLSTSHQGNQTVVNGTVQFQEPPGVINLQVYIGASAANYSSEKATGSREIPVSQVCSLTVTPASTGQNSGGYKNGGGDVDHGKSHGDKANEWGEVVGGIIGGIIKSRNKDNNSNDPPQGNTIASGNPAPHDKKPPPPQPTPVPLAGLSARGLQLKYPQGWNFHSEILNLGGPLNIRNFDQYLRGGVLPAGGAAIDITTVPFDGEGDLKSIAQEDLGATDASAYRVDDRPALFVSYTDEFAPGFSYDNRAVYVAVGETIYKFFLSYRNGDPGSGNFVRDFQQVLASTHFIRN
jgi:hypothetical protein